MAELLKDHRIILLGQTIVSCDDNLDLLNVSANSPERVQRWRLILEEHRVELKHAKDDENEVADVFSEIEIHTASKKELQQREALTMLNAGRTSNIKTSNIEINPSENK